MFVEDWNGESIVEEGAIVQVDDAPKEPSLLRQVGDRVTRNAARFFGALIGLVVAVLFLTIGFWKTALIALCITVGAFLGGPSDRRRALFRSLSKLIPNRHDVE